MSTKVLVFESDAAFAAELRSELAKLGCSTSVVDDGNAGLQQAASEKPDLILLSIELPRMNGFSVCNKLKKDSKLKEVPLIIMSTESSDETFDQHRKLRTRAEDYVHKPIAFGELLQHINQFIQLEGESPQGDSGIVIEDEIQISSIDLEEEGTLVVDDQGTGASPKRVSHSPKRAASEPPKMKNVDEDIDAFIEGGFGKMTTPAHGDAPQNGSPAEAKKKSVAPPPEAPAPVDDGRVAELERELAQAHEAAAQLRADFDSRIEAEQKKLDAELDDLRGKLATAGKSGVSSREFLDLREALNKKDKEILSLKEQLGKKDKEIVDVREKALAFERTKADLDDKMLVALRELEEQKERLEALARDKDQAKKASEDFKSRLTKVQGELETRINDLNETKSRQAALQTELETRTKDLEDARVKVIEDAAAHEASSAAAQASHEGALAKQQAEAAAALETAQQEKAAELDAAKQKATSDLAAALAAREAELKAESDSRLGALHRAHQEEVGRSRRASTRRSSKSREMPRAHSSPHVKRSSSRSTRGSRNAQSSAVRRKSPRSSVTAMRGSPARCGTVTRRSLLRCRTATRRSRRRCTSVMNGSPRWRAWRANGCRRRLGSAMTASPRSVRISLSSAKRSSWSSPRALRGLGSSSDIPVSFHR